MTQPSQRFSFAEIDKLVNDTIKYVLVQEYTKYPVKRTDITKHAMQGVGRQYGQIIKLVQKKMKHIFGLELIEIQNAQRYIVVNKFPTKTTAGILRANDKRRSKYGLLMFLLAHIFMGGGVMKETDIWAILKKLKVQDEEHPVFGDVKKLITVDFVRQMYLDLTRIAEADPPVLEFRWGARAEHEVDKEAILNFVSLMHSNMDPKRWTEQWNIMQQEKAARNLPEHLNGHSDDDMTG